MLFVSQAAARITVVSVATRLGSVVENVTVLVWQVSGCRVETPQLLLFLLLIDIQAREAVRNDGSIENPTRVHSLSGTGLLRHDVTITEDDDAPPKCTQSDRNPSGSKYKSNKDSIEAMHWRDPDQVGKIFTTKVQPSWTKVFQNLAGSGISAREPNDMVVVAVVGLGCCTHCTCCCCCDLSSTTGCV